FHQYQVVGRGLPSETDEHPKIYRMKLWATNEVRAKSKFWYFLRKLKKVKKSNGQMLAINEYIAFSQNVATMSAFHITVCKSLISPHFRMRIVVLERHEGLCSHELPQHFRNFNTVFPLVILKDATHGPSLSL
ncbi:hypothetical protein C3L33_22782, partial [Rhododendron williamsianum]